MKVSLQKPHHWPCGALRGEEAAVLAQGKRLDRRRRGARGGRHPPQQLTLRSDGIAFRAVGAVAPVGLEGAPAQAARALGEGVLQGLVDERADGVQDDGALLQPEGRND